MNYLSPCGRGRPNGAGEGYSRTDTVLKRFQKVFRTNQTDAEKMDLKLYVYWNNTVLDKLESVVKTVLNTPHPPLARRPLPQGER